jgi:transcriptional regulator with GAF, ATPase, and Fis domain
MYKNVNGKKPFIVNPENEKDPWGHFESYLYVYANDSISENRDEIAFDVSKQLKKKGIKDMDNKNRMVLWVLRNEMDDEATETACSDLFHTNTFKVNNKNFITQVNKYIDLYIEKYRLAESLKEQETQEKEENVELYGSSGLVSFGTILAIASILILYSIRQILKDKKD